MAREVPLDPQTSVMLFLFGFNCLAPWWNNQRRPCLRSAPTALDFDTLLLRKASSEQSASTLSFVSVPITHKIPVIWQNDLEQTRLSTQPIIIIRETGDLITTHLPIHSHDATYEHLTDTLENARLAACGVRPAVLYCSRCFWGCRGINAKTHLICHVYSGICWKITQTLSLRKSQTDTPSSGVLSNGNLKYSSSTVAGRSTLPPDNTSKPNPVQRCRGGTQQRPPEMCKSFTYYCLYARVSTRTSNSLWANSNTQTIPRP